MRPTPVKFPQVDDMEDQTVFEREAVDDDEGIDPQNKKRTRKAKNLVGGVGGAKPVSESEIIVPETPTYERTAAEAKRKEYTRASGRISALEDTALTLPEASFIGKRRKSRRRLYVGKGLKTVVMQTTGNGTLSVHKEISMMAAETFGKIRQLLLERTVDTLSKAFLNSSCAEQAIDVQMEVFGVGDDKFLEMFVAPGAIEQLEQEYVTLQKRSMTLLICLHEFHTLA